MATVNLGRVKPVWKNTWTASTAYVVDDIVRDGVTSYICINAHTSGASFATGSDWQVMSQGSNVGTGSAGQVLKTNSAGNGIEWGTDKGGALLQAKSFTYTNRVALGSTNQDWYEYGTFSKISPTSTLIVASSTSGHGDSAGSCGVGLRIGTTYRYGSYDYSQTSNSKSTSNNYNFGTMGGTTGVAWGVSWGWKVGDSSTGKPFHVLNPNSADDNRNQQTTSTISIWEVEA